MTTTIEDLKTHRMLLLELQFGKDIRELIAGGTVREAGARLGVHYSMISRWRQRLQVQVTEPTSAIEN